MFAILHEIYVFNGVLLYIYSSFKGQHFLPVYNVLTEYLLTCYC